MTVMDLPLGWTAVEPNLVNNFVYGVTREGTTINIEEDRSVWTQREYKQQAKTPEEQAKIVPPFGHACVTSAPIDVILHVMAVAHQRNYRNPLRGRQ